MRQISEALSIPAELPIKSIYSVSIMMMLHFL